MEIRGPVGVLYIANQNSTVSGGAIENLLIKPEARAPRERAALAMRHRALFNEARAHSLHRRRKPV